MTVSLRHRSWILRAFLFLTVLVGLSACQVMPARSPAEIERDAATEAYKQFGQMITVVSANYIEPVSTKRLLTLALNGMESTGTALPAGAHEIVQNSIRAVAAVDSERIQLVAFTEGIRLLSAGQPASTPRLVRAAMTSMANGLDPHTSYNLNGNAPTFASVGSVGLLITRSGSEAAVGGDDSQFSRCAGCHPAW